MNHFWLITLFLLFFGHVSADHAKFYNITPCDSNANYPIVVSNVEIEENNGKVFVSGSISSDVNLTAPIKASLTVKRYIKWANVWLWVVCGDAASSCSFDDLCSYGIPQNKTCPDNFVKNGVPCRCPIKKGTYTLPPEQKIYLFTIPKEVYLMSRHRFSTPVSGIYWVEVQITSQKDLLSCYQIYLHYDDVSADWEQNEVVPIVLVV